MASVSIELQREKVTAVDLRSSDHTCTCVSPSGHPGQCTRCLTCRFIEDLAALSSDRKGICDSQLYLWLFQYVGLAT